MARSCTPLPESRNLVRLSLDLEQTLRSRQTVSRQELSQRNWRKFMTDLRMARYPKQAVPSACVRLWLGISGQLCSRRKFFEISEITEFTPRNVGRPARPQMITDERGALKRVGLRMMDGKLNDMPHTLDAIAFNLAQNPRFSGIKERGYSQSRKSAGCREPRRSHIDRDTFTV
jgi:hypothetical protein